MLELIYRLDTCNYLVIDTEKKTCSRTLDYTVLYHPLESYQDQLEFEWLGYPSNPFDYQIIRTKVVDQLAAV